MTRRALRLLIALSLGAVSVPRIAAQYESAQASAAVKPLRVEDSLGTLSFAGRTPIQLSPDGEWVAYTIQDPRLRDSTKDPRYFYYTRTGAFLEALGSNVWIANTKTGVSRNLTDSQGTSWAPAWSPDGKRLVFYSDRSGTAQLWTWERSSNRLRRVSDAIVRPFFSFEAPRWSPDGRQVLFKALPADLTIESAADLIVGNAQATGWSDGPQNDAGRPTVRVYRSTPQEPSRTTENPQTELELGSGFNRYLATLL